jgi:hypothetical protein
MCKNAHFLHGGVCQAACPAGTSSTGQGNFNKRCHAANGISAATAAAAAAAATACVPKANNCHQCTEDSSGCSMCKNAYFLHGGVCQAACPPGISSVGAGNFNKRCE